MSWGKLRAPVALLCLAKPITVWHSISSCTIQFVAYDVFPCSSFFLFVVEGKDYGLLCIFWLIYQMVCNDMGFIWKPIGELFQLKEQ